MKDSIDYSINVRGRLFFLSKPVVMGILNATPDSFYAPSRAQSSEAITARAHQIVAEGGSIIDVGACSTRPGGTDVDEEGELERLRHALPLVRDAEPDAVISVDTYRPRVAQVCIEEYGVDIINDVHGGDDEGMFETVASHGTPYILMSSGKNVHDMLIEFSEKVQRLRDLKQKDIILDPGFGFGKTMEENYALLRDMDRLNVLGLPLLVGVSRKRMVHQLLGITPTESLNGTTVLNTFALERDARILRVHDVKEAVQAVRIFEELEVRS